MKYEIKENTNTKFPQAEGCGNQFWRCNVRILLQKYLVILHLLVEFAIKAVQGCYGKIDGYTLKYLLKERTMLWIKLD